MHAACPASICSLPESGCAWIVRPGVALAWQTPRCPSGLPKARKKPMPSPAGAVALDLLGVWNFKGKNDFGGTTILVDFDSVAWNGREVRLVFDSDVSTSPEVRKALERLTEHLSRKGAAVRQVYLPPTLARRWVSMIILCWTYPRGPRSPHRRATSATATRASPDRAAQRSPSNLITAAGLD